MRVYYARYVAKSVVKTSQADRYEVSESYSIGIADTVSVSVDAFGSSVLPDNELPFLILQLFDFAPRNIRKEL